jgi:ribonuclease BN (tRNA processing enzyme)
MKIIWNGTGSAWSNQYANSSAIVERDGKRLLVDCGHTVPGRLRQMGLTLRDIDGVFISHLHGDHIYGLEEWGFRNMLQWGIRPPLFIADTLIDLLWQNVLAGTMAQTCGKACLLEDYFEVIPMRPDEPRHLGPFTLTSHPVRHVPHAHAYGVRVGTTDSTVAFTCDALADADPWFYQNAKAVFHDCSFSPHFPDTVHSHFEELVHYPAEWRSRTWLVHYDDSIAIKRTDATFQARLAATGLRLTTPFEEII